MCGAWRATPISSPRSYTTRGNLIYINVTVLHFDYFIMPKLIDLRLHLVMPVAYRQGQVNCIASNSS